MSTDIQFTLSFVSALDICLTSFGDARTFAARVDFVSPRPVRIADQANYGPLGDSAEFSARVKVKIQFEGQIGQLCPTFAKCRTRTRSDSNSKAEFGSGPVKGGIAQLWARLGSKTKATFLVQNMVSASGPALEIAEASIH
ncbi:hypothetical protein L3X38_045386 [Prunus dulcis]|uniref:Uncharacterized protein n=1 Tax=Prunus dulcis TaxID=3755 RepID=A0AAD4YP49_PRUDU|nr:hypothetical protein L3X38_045386 [Prunus dulcis]